MTRLELPLSAAIWGPAIAALGVQLAIALPQNQPITPLPERTSQVSIVESVGAMAHFETTELARQETAREAKAFGKQVRADQRKRKAEHDAAAKRARALEGIVANGAPLEKHLRKRIASSKADFTAHMEYIDQRPIMPAGCEVMALTVTLRAMGYDVEPATIADRYLPGGTGAQAYLGSPYGNGGGLPPSIARAANGWLSDHEDGALAGTPLAGGTRAFDLTGTPFDSLSALVDAGFPVLVWTTEAMSEPWVGASWYSPEHCVALYGIEGDKALVSDSLAGLVERDRDAFARIYGLCGNRAVAILPNK